MEIITIGFIIILNIVAIYILYKSLGKIEIKNKIIIMVIGILLMYVILYITCYISSLSINRGVASSSRQLLIFTFLPINIISILTPIIRQMGRLKQKEITNEILKKKLILHIIIGIIIIVIEGMYIKDIQKGIEEIYKIGLIEE